MKPIRSFKRTTGLFVLSVAIAILSVSLRPSTASAGGAQRLTRISTQSLLKEVSAATAGNCLQDEYSLSASQTLNCTSNDVKVAKVTNIRDPITGQPITACNLGQPFNFLADFTIVTSSQSSRSNIGLYFAIGGQGSALTGQCADSIIAPPHPTNAQCTGAGQPYACCTGNGTGTCVCGGAGNPPCLGSDHYDEFDAPPDNCGDTSSSDPNGGTQVVTIEIDNFLCQPPAGSSQLVMNDCTSWQVPGKTLQCVSPSPDYPYEPAAIPGSPSKCNCDTIPLNITAQEPSVTVTKNCSTANGDGTLPTPSCTLGDPGGTVTYTVDVQNGSNFGGITLNQICDTAYGNIFTATTVPAQPACPTGSVGSIASTTCSLPQTIAATSDYSCQFTVNQGENPATVTDTASARGVGQDGTTPFSGTSNSVQVTTGEADATASTVKTVASATPPYGCATVRYGVEVDNTSASTSDESETLSALTDSYFGNIAVGIGQPLLGTNVTGTTCGVASGSYGTGTMASGQPGALMSQAGTLPATIAVGGKYNCEFDAQVCGNTGPLTEPPNATTCAAGIENTDTVSGTLVGDESDQVVTQKTAKLTVDVCFSTSIASQ